MKNLVNENIKELQPYKVPELEFDVKLDANENPYPVPGDLPADLKDELKELIFKALWNYYPDAEGKDLKEEIAKYVGVKRENILLGNGSDELLLNLMLTFVNKDKAILVHPPTFSMYKILANVANGKVVEVPLDDDFELKREEMLEAVKREDVVLTFITYPNNPTGNLFHKETIIEIIENAYGIVVLDEAYFEFAGDTFAEYIDKYDNLIVLRTFSKAFGMAGLRVGYMVANEGIVNEVNKVRLPYNLNKISQIIALKMLSNKEEFARQIKVILDERNRVEQELKGIDGIEIYKSDTNSIFFKTEKSEEVFEKLLENKILVRKFKGDMTGFLRITIGLQEDNDKVIEVIKSIF